MRTTVYLDSADYERLKRVAEAGGRSAAELIRVAVHNYLESEHAGGRPDWIGAVGSGDGQWAQEAGERLEGFGES